MFCWCEFEGVVIRSRRGLYKYCSTTCWENGSVKEGSKSAESKESSLTGGA